jgi:hypothetical protein
MPRDIGVAHDVYCSRQHAQQQQDMPSQGFDIHEIERRDGVLVMVYNFCVQPYEYANNRKDHGTYLTKKTRSTDFTGSFAQRATYNQG